MKGRGSGEDSGLVSATPVARDTPLSDHREQKAEEVVAVREAVEHSRESRTLTSEASYPYVTLQKQITQTLGAQPSTLAIDIISRDRFDADLSIRSPELLSAQGKGTFIKETLPRWKQQLESSDLKTQGVIERVDTKGIFLNVRLSDEQLFRCLSSVQSLKDQYGEGVALAGNRIVVDYSSPNAAKNLHAGHIRSTIIGEALSNIYDACGATVFRVNHLNDWGGFGFLIEAQERTGISLDSNAALASLYALRRTAERASSSEDFFQELTDNEKELLVKCLGEFSNLGELQEQWYAFGEKSKERFIALEQGNAHEVAVWKQMVDLSLADFEKFYSLLGTSHDITLGESYYAGKASELLEESLARGSAFHFSSAEAQAVMATRIEQDEKAAEYERRELESDIGAIVVPLENDKRLVLQRSDGTTIYASRDLAAIKSRGKEFECDEIVYVVGQEQSAYFRDLFDAANSLVPEDSRPSKLTHVPFGFYVNPQKQKLSSRDGASNVMRLLNSSIAHFEKTLRERGTLPEDKVQQTASELATGSITFNDLRRDRVTPVPLKDDLAEQMTEFERSGGAYVMYTACRANSILGRHEGTVPSIEDIDSPQLNEQEIGLIKELVRYPEVVTRAATEHSPTIVVNYTLELARQYNSYYSECPVFRNGVPDIPRLALTQAVNQGLRNALRLLNINCPERI